MTRCHSLSNLFFLVCCLLGLQVHEVHAAVPAAPSGLKATAIAHNQIALSWIDNSSDEEGFQLEIKVGSGAFSALGFQQAANVKSELLSGTVAGTSYTFRIRSYNRTGPGGSILYSATYNTATAVVTPAVSVKFDAPTSLTGTSTNNSATLNWTDNATVESGFEVYVKLTSGGQFSFVGSYTANTSGVISGLTAATSYDFVVRAYKNVPSASGGTDTFYTSFPSVTLVAKDEITSKTGTSGIPGASFSHTFTNTTASTVSSRTLTPLPGTLIFNSATGGLSGTYPALGVYTLTYTVNFANGWSQNQTFYIRVRPPAGAPAVATTIPAWTTAAGAVRDTPLAGTFTDVEAESAVRVSTTLGDMDFILFDTATPATVTNFKNYLGRYPEVVFHRSIAGFVIQAGGFKSTGTGSSFTSVTTDPTVVNEPGIANLRGTISMAKLGGNPNSATSQFFVSLGDNRSNLDFQNGGFTVFGRVAGNGMNVADGISLLPTSTYGLLLDGSTTPTSFADFPMNAPSAPAVMDQTKVVKLNSVVAIPTLSHAVTGNSNPASVDATVVGGQLRLTSLAGGISTVTLTATDLDNLTNTQTVEVSVTDTFSTWGARQTFPGGQNAETQNPDGDSLNNLLEFAFLGNPASNSQAEVPTDALAGAPPAEQFMTLTFPVRKFTTGLSYAVEVSSALTGGWTTLWTTADGFNHARVVNAVDQTDRTVVTIEDTAALTAGAKRFMRVRVTQL